MKIELKLTGFAKYAWFALAYNIVVILWGVFLRASKSGDGCGQHWITCNGEVIPSAPQMKTVIEFSHRITSSLDGIVVLILLIWAVWSYFSRKTERKKHLLKTAVASFFFVLVEAAIGGGIVLTGNTAETLTAARPFWMIGHLTSTFILLAFLTLTAWFASGGKSFNFKAEPKVLILLLLAIIGIFFIGMTGSVAALSNMIFPSQSLAEGFRQDFSPTSHILLRLRIFHPIASISVGVFLIFLAGWLRKREQNDIWVNRWSNALSLLVLLQIFFGAITLVTGAPIVMQLIHLFLADALWISFVLLAAVFLAAQNEKLTLSKLN